MHRVISESTFPNDSLLILLMFKVRGFTCILAIVKFGMCEKLKQQSIKDWQSVSINWGTGITSVEIIDISGFSSHLK